jgi:hypothetical protein
MEGILLLVAAGALAMLVLGKRAQPTPPPENNTVAPDAIPLPPGSRTESTPPVTNRTTPKTSRTTPASPNSPEEAERLRAPELRPVEPPSPGVVGPVPPLAEDYPPDLPPVESTPPPVSVLDELAALSKPAQPPVPPELYQ